MWRRTPVISGVVALCLIAVSCGDDGGSGVTTTGSIPALTTVTDAAWDTSTVATTIVGPAASSTTTGEPAMSSPCVVDPATTTTVTQPSTGTSVVVTQPATGTSVVVTQPPTGTTMVGGVAIRRDGSVYQIDWEALVGPVIFAPPGGGPDPYYVVQNTPASDGFLFAVEAHTVCGTQWSGQLGTFAIDCSATGTGICVRFDPDGAGPMPDLGADFMVTGTIEILQADSDNFIAELGDVAFSDGSTIPGPLVISR